MTNLQRWLSTRWWQELIVWSTLWYWFSTIKTIGRFPGGDGPHILGTAGRLAQQVYDGSIYWFILCFSSLLGPHPPFAYLPFTTSAVLFPEQSWNHLIGGMIVLWLIWDGLYRLKAGIIGWLWICASPLTWLQAENAGIDLVAAACIIQSLSHLYASDKLSKNRHVLGWGFWIGAAFMTKYTAPMFLWMPCLLAGTWAIRYGRMRKIGLGVLAFLIIALPWWSTHINQVMGYVLASGDASSGLLTNKAIIDNPWSSENITWYLGAFVDALGWQTGFWFLVFLVIPKKNSPKYILFSGILGGWLMLNSQKQRQDRYLTPAYPLMSAMIGHSPLGILSIGALSKILPSVQKIYFSAERMPTQRSYTHEYAEAGATWPLPSESYWPISQDPRPWKIDFALEKLAKYTGTDDVTVGFLLDERGGAPGYGIVLSRAIVLGYRWHIATAMIARPMKGYQEKGVTRPLASIFVGPFLFGEWPSRDFDVMLSMVVPNEDQQRTKWLKSTGMVVVDEWELPQGRKGQIWLKADR